MFQTNRISAHPIQDLILHRWSPRAMTGNTIPKKILLSLFEAAHWAPSSYNSQPWRFLYATKDSKHWETFFNLLVEFNQSWCKNAAALVCVLAQNTSDYNGKPLLTGQFDTGAAWENLAIEATSKNIVAHAMGGFDYEKAKKILHVPKTFDVMCMIAIGEVDDKNTLPKDLQKTEKPSNRKPLDSIITEGPFTWTER